MGRPYKTCTERMCFRGWPLPPAPPQKEGGRESHSPSRHALALRWWLTVASTQIGTNEAAEMAVDSVEVRAGAAPSKPPQELAQPGPSARPGT